MSNQFDRARHIRYFSYCLRMLPSVYHKLDSNRLTLVHFCIQALDILGSLQDDGKPAVVDKEAILQWMNKLKVMDGGYVGGTYLCEDDTRHRHGHIAMTYTALCILVALNGNIDDDVLDRTAIVQSLRKLQRDDGSFQSVPEGSEQDMRFLYCACAISHMLNDWSGVDIPKAIEFIRNCRSFDGAIALIPGQEGHGGSTFCGVAALVLMGQVDAVLDDNDNGGGSWRQDLIRWCVSRQVGGMQGRPNKDEDTCYSYWIGGTLRLLGRDDLLDLVSLRNYVLTCQSHMGGFGKVIGALPDVLHSFYSLAWLSLSQTNDGEEQSSIRRLNCTLGICQERADVFGGDLP